MWLPRIFSQDEKRYENPFRLPTPDTVKQLWPESCQEDQMGPNYRRPTPKPPFAWQPSQEYEPYTQKNVAVKGVREIDVVCRIFLMRFFFGGREARDSGNLFEDLLRMLPTSQNKPFDERLPIWFPSFTLPKKQNLWLVRQNKSYLPFFFAHGVFFRAAPVTFFVFGCWFKYLRIGFFDPPWLAPEHGSMVLLYVEIDDWLVVSNIFFFPPNLGEMIQ